MTLLLVHSVMYKGGLPSRICDAAHTSKFIITTGADGALCMKQWLCELLNRLTGLIGHWEYSRNWDFTSTTISKFKTMWSTSTSKSVTVNIQFPSSFPEIWIWISLPVVYWSEQFPNWPRRWMRANRRRMNYGLDERNFSYSSLQVIPTSNFTFLESLSTPRKWSDPREL